MKISGSTTAWCRWRDEVSRQGSPSTGREEEKEEQGCAEGEGKVCLSMAKSARYIEGEGRGGATPRVPTLGGATAPQDGRCGGQRGEEGVAHHLVGLRPTWPRVCPPFSLPCAMG